MELFRLRKQRDAALKLADYQREENIELKRKIKELESRNEILLEYCANLKATASQQAKRIKLLESATT